MRKVLILEDARIGGQTLAALESRGLEASWYIGVKSIADGKLVGIRSDFSEETVSLDQYFLAYVDGFLYIESIMGWDLLPSLKPLMFTVGTSSLGEIGAHMQIDKAEMLETLEQVLEAAQVEN